MTPIDAVRGVLGPMTSEAKAREVVLAVLRSVREPGDGTIEKTAVQLSMADPDERGLPHGWEMAPFYRMLARVACRASADSLIQELDT